MEISELIHLGMAEETTLTVEEKHTAAHVGSGSLRVFATPIMIGIMEGVSLRLLAKHLPEGQTSVGILVNVRHLAPTPQGAEVTVRAEVSAVEGRTVTFHVSAWDTVEMVGDGEHQRMVIDEARFLKRVAAKSGEAL